MDQWVQVDQVPFITMISAPKMLWQYHCIILVAKHHPGINKGNIIRQKTLGGFNRNVISQMVSFLLILVYWKVCCEPLLTSIDHG